MLKKGTLIKTTLFMKMNSSSLMLILAFIAGSFIPFQTASNGVLTKATGNIYFSTLIVFSVATLSVALVFLLRGESIPPIVQMKQAPLYSWLVGGVAGAAYILILIYLLPRTGIATLTGLVVTGQLITALVIDHFGLLNVPLHPLNWQRIAGVSLLIGGQVLIKKY